MKTASYTTILSAFCAAIALLGLSTLPVAAASLEVRRAQKNFEENMLPEKQKQLNEKLGFELPMEFDYESINAADNATAIYSALPGGAVYYIALSFEEVGVDDLGKEALKEKVTKVRFVHSATPEDAGVKMDGQVVTVTMDGTTATSETSYTELKQFLEKNL